MRNWPNTWPPSCVQLTLTPSWWHASWNMPGSSSTSSSRAWPSISLIRTGSKWVPLKGKKNVFDDAIYFHFIGSIFNGFDKMKKATFIKTETPEMPIPYGAWHAALWCVFFFFWSFCMQSATVDCIVLKVSEVSMLQFNISKDHS